MREERERERKALFLKGKTIFDKEKKITEILEISESTLFLLLDVYHTYFIVTAMFLIIVIVIVEFISTWIVLKIIPQLSLSFNRSFTRGTCLSLLIHFVKHK